jgi:hypothetical protein
MNRRIAGWIILTALALVACGQPAADTAGGQTQAPPAAEDTLPVPTLTPLEPEATVDPMLGRLPVVNTPSVVDTPTPESTAGGGAEDLEPVIYEALDGTGAALGEAWAQVYAQTPGQPFSLTISDAELEAAIWLALQSGGYGENLDEMDLTFEDGQVRLAFKITLPGIDRAVDASIVFSVSVDADGTLSVTVISAQAGAVELPAETAQVLTLALQMALDGSYQSELEVDITFTEVVIDAGQITLSGYITPS